MYVYTFATSAAHVLQIVHVVFAPSTMEVFTAISGTSNHNTVSICDDTEILCESYPMSFHFECIVKKHMKCEQTQWF